MADGGADRSCTGAAILKRGEKSLGEKGGGKTPDSLRGKKRDAMGRLKNAQARRKPSSVSTHVIERGERS